MFNWFCEHVKNGDIEQARHVADQWRSCDKVIQEIFTIGSYAIFRIGDQQNIDGYDHTDWRQDICETDDTCPYCTTPIFKYMTASKDMHDKYHQHDNEINTWFHADRLLQKRYRGRIRYWAAPNKSPDITDT